MKPLIIDFETRSLIDLPRQGTTVYARDPSTKVLCLGYQWEGRTFVIPRPHPGRKNMPPRIREALAAPDTVLVAHNALFDKAIWEHVLQWTTVPLDGWWCTSSIAGLYNLPQELGALTETLWPKSVDKQKDLRGKQLIQLLSKPISGTTTFRDDPELLQEMYAYCAQDVKVTARAWSILPRPPSFERRIQIADMAANERGYEVDRAFCEKAVAIDSKIQQRVVAACEDITGLRPTQTAKLKDWLAAKDMILPNMSRQTIETRLAGGVDDKVIRKVLELRIAGARGSTHKFEGLMRFCTSTQPRITHHTRYAAGNTQRWIARGAQIHNFRSRNLISYDLPGIKREVMTDTLPTDVDVRNYIGGAVRAAIIAKPGMKLALGDYSGMENRMLMYLSGEEQQLQLIRTGLDVYRDLATRVFGIPDPARIDPWQRQICKHMVLGLGFGMGHYAFFVNLKFHFQVDLSYRVCKAIVGDELDRLTDDYITNLRDDKRLMQYTYSQVCLDNQPLTRKHIHGLVTTQYLVRLFRGDFNAMSTWWATLDGSFKDLMDSRTGASIHVPPAGTMHRVKRAIVFELPSGRPMYYWHPRYRRGKDPITDKATSELVYDQATGGRMKTLKGYGARFGANFVQAISRDIMADAFADLHETDDWRPTFTCHDEIVSETENDDGEAYEQFILASAAARPWSAAIPLKVDADISDCWLSKG